LQHTVPPYPVAGSAAMRHTKHDDVRTTLKLSK
jgi:hypothetical protein